MLPAVLQPKSVCVRLVQSREEPIAAAWARPACLLPSGPVSNAALHSPELGGGKKRSEPPVSVWVISSGLVCFFPA